MPKKYKITNGGSSPDSSDLIDLAIEETSDGTGYQLMAKRPVLATSSTRTPPFTFNFNLDGWNWNLVVEQITATNMGGTWDNTDPNNASPAGEEDVWVASGTGTGEDEDARSASAK